MPNKKNDQPVQLIERNLSVNFSGGNQSDQQLKLRLQRHLDSRRFASKSEMGKYFLLKGLDADDQQDSSEDQEDDHSREELLVLLRGIQAQLADLRTSEKQVEAIVQQVADIDQRTRTIRPAFAEAMAGLLIELGDWEEEDAIRWAKENLLGSKGNTTTWENQLEES